MTRGDRFGSAFPILTVVGLGVLAVIAFGSHVLHGGLSSDDWAGAADFRESGYIHGAARSFGSFGARPLMALLQPGRFALLGTSARPHLVLAVALGLTACMA